MVLMCLVKILISIKKLIFKILGKSFLEEDTFENNPYDRVADEIDD